MTDLVNISLPTAGGYALLGYCVVFFWVASRVPSALSTSNS